MQDHNAVTCVPKISDDDEFLTVLRYCYSKRKNRRVGKELLEKTRKPRKRLRKEIPKTLAEPRVWIIRNENEFRDFRQSGLWEDLSFEEKRKIYDLQDRGHSLEIRVNYNQKIDRTEVDIQRTYESLQHKAQTPLLQPVHPSHRRNYSKKPRLPSLISVQDFQEFGKINRYLRINPEADDREIARQTRLPLHRVRVLRALIMHELEASKQDEN